MENTLVTEQKIIQDVKAPFFQQTYHGLRKQDDSFKIVLKEKPPHD
ncbi:hypothetical protein [Sphingobacterium siyangense]